MRLSVLNGEALVSFASPEGQIVGVLGTFGRRWSYHVIKALRAAEGFIAFISVS